MTKPVVIWSMLLTGLGVGWLIGLSVSPVVSIVISSVTASVAAIVAALSGLQDKPKWTINPLPLAIFVGGVVIGSIVGVWARNHDWLGRSAAAEVTYWMDAGLDLPREEVAARLFEQQYTAESSGVGSGQMSETTATVLFSAAREECAALRTRSGSALRGELLSSTIPGWPVLPSLVDDDLLLEQLVQEVLCAE